MNKNPASQSGMFNPRILAAFTLCSAGVLLAMLSFAATPSSGTIPQPTTITVGKKGGVAWSDTGKVGVRTSASSSPWQDAAKACLSTSPSAQCDIFTLTFSAASNFWTSVAGPPLTGHIHTRLVQPDANTWIDLIVFDSQKLVACFSYLGRPGQEDISCDIQRPTPNTTYSVVAYYEAGSGTHGYSATADLYIENDAAPNTVENNAITFGPATWVDLQRVLGADPMVDVDMRGNGRVFVAFPWGRISTGSPQSLVLPNIVARSLDRGETFRVLFDESCPTSNSQPHCGDTGFGHAHISLSPDTDNVYLASFGHPIDSSITVQASANGGDTWPVDMVPPFVPTVGLPWVLADFGQTAYACEGGAFNEQYATTTDGGMTWSSTPALPFGKWATFENVAMQPILDRSAQSRGFHNIYQPFAEQANNNGVVGSNVPVVGMAVSTDATATFTSSDVGADLPFLSGSTGTYPWAAVDSAGNLYAVWQTNSGWDIVMSTSPISDAANDPSSTPPGKPGTKWTNPVRVSTGAAQTAVISNVVAGSPGNVAIVYWGTDGYGDPGSQPPTAKWYAFVAHSSNALDSSPSFTQSVISERFIHTGCICAFEGACPTSCPNRALRNFMSVGYDPDGRLYAAWGEDNNDVNRTEIRFAKQLTGPSLIAGKPDFHDPAPSSPMSDPSGDATWPNRIVGGTNLPGADITRLAVTNDATTIQFALTVADATQFQQALSAVSAISAVPADRLLFLVRFETADQEYFAAYEYSNGGATRAFTGRILSTDGIENANGMSLFTNAIGFVAHDPATASVSGNTITITQNLSAFGNPTKLLSVVGATLIGPSENNETRANLLNTVDATRAFDYTLSSIPRVVSRMTHGSAGTFDVDLPPTGTRGVECRSGGTNSNYTLVFTFPNNLTSVASASVTSHDPATGTGSVAGSGIGPNPNQYTVNLTGVSTGQYITVTLNSVLDATGASGNVTGPQMGVLIGDVNASGVVTSGDTNLCKAQALQPVTNANFRNDVNASGSITTGDVNLIKQNALSQLPTPP